MSDKFQMSVGQAHELEMAFGRSGWTNADVKKLATGGTLERILSVMRGEAEVKFPEITVGGRVYEILPFLRGDEKSVNGNTMVARAKKANANLGKEDGEHFLENQADILAVLRGKIAFVFSDWRFPGGMRGVACLFGGSSDRWYQDWRWLSSDWNGYYRVLRRKSA
jgi:hypothetical protein